MAIVGAGNVVVTKAGGRWVLAWTGALAGAAGWTHLVTAVASVGLRGSTEAGAPAWSPASPR